MKIYWFVMIYVCCESKVIQLVEERPKKEWTPEGKCIDSWKWILSSEEWETVVSSSGYKQNCSLYTNYWPINVNLNMVFVNITGHGNAEAPCVDHYTVKVMLGVKSTNYRKITNIPTKKNSGFFNYSEALSINVSDAKLGLKFAFQSTGFCGAIDRFQVFYYECPTNMELVKFESHLAPSQTDSPIEIPGECVAHSVPSVETSKLLMKCYYNGRFQIQGGCRCDKGFEKTDKNGCKGCGLTKFKPNVGNEKCQSCGEHAISKNGGVACECEANYFRSIGEENVDGANCYRPPDAPKNIVPRDITEDSAIIEFEAPDNIGDAALGIYVLNCTACGKGGHFPLYSNTSPFNITGLGALATYQLLIYNRNRITNQTGHFNPKMFNITTLVGGRPGVIQDFRANPSGNGSVVLRWNAPFVKGGRELFYVIKYGPTKQITKNTYIILKSKSTSQKYRAEIYAQVTINGETIAGEVFRSEIIEVKAHGIPLRTTIGVVVGIAVLIIVISLIFFLVWRRRYPRFVQRMEDGTVITPSRFLPGSKLYIDPLTYSDVDDAVEEFANEIERKNLTMNRLIGGGEFAEVFTGTLVRASGKVTNVAIKTLKSGASKKDRDDFLSEAAILGQFTDTNVISLEGVVMKDRPHLIVLEYMANGSLDQYLQKNDLQFQVVELLGMARCVASGMAYLSDKGFIHRDLAARNILVDEHNICKISDFGMSRELKLDDTYETQGGKIPVRWTAPEAIQYKKFTSASDCWSYGVLLWEIMSYGERPYWDWGNYTVLERLNAGYRLPPPMNCRKVIHNLMLECWNKERTKRPRFKDIRERIEQWIRSPELLGEIASVVTKTDENLDYTVLETIHKWLEAIGMEQYSEMFVNNNYSTPKQILDVVDNDLIRIGIAPIGHRKKILKAIKNTRNQVDARHRGGGTVVNDSFRKKTFSLSRKK